MALSPAAARRTRLLALGGLAGPLVFAVVVVVCAARRPEYSHATRFISELGARGTPNAMVMNLAGFVLTGLLIGAFALSLLRLLPRRRLARVAAACLGVFGVGLVLAGIIPCEPGCPQAEPTLHDGVSIVALLSGAIGVGSFGFAVRGVSAWRPLWVYSVISAVAAIGFMVGLAQSIDGRDLTGVWQRLLVGTLLLWCGVVARHAVRPRAG